MQIKSLLLVVGGIAVFAAVSETDKRMNYVETDAVVTSATYDCFVRNGKKRLVEKKTDELAYMDCDVAPYAAQEFGYEKSDVHKRISMVYRYNSPVDGSRQLGEYKGTGAAEVAYKKGTHFTVYAHKEDPAKSRLH